MKDPWPDACPVGVSVEVADCTFGRAAEGVLVTLRREVGAQWRLERAARTDAAGSVTGLCGRTHRGRYRLVLDLDSYFPALGVTPRQSVVDVTFWIFHTGESAHLRWEITPSSISVCRVVSGSDARALG